jgi:hypothetical protein
MTEAQYDREVASRAISAFYSGSSKPFKPASGTFADINPSNGKAATTRQAALALVLILLGDGNMLRDGSFVRGNFRVPAIQFDPNADRSQTILAQPESGCLGNMLGRTCEYVSGPTAGKQQARAIYRLLVPTVLAEIRDYLGAEWARAAEEKLATFPTSWEPTASRSPTLPAPAGRLIAP